MTDQPIEIKGQLDDQGLTIEADSTGDGAPKRTVTGWAVPWDKPGNTSAGWVKFTRGSLNPELVPAVNRDHNRERLVGKVAHAQDSPMGLHVKARISATDLGNETLTLAGDGIIDGFSVEVMPTKYEFEDDPKLGQVMVVSEGEWVGLALTPRPAFGQARVTHVAASADERKGPIVADELTAVATALADVAAEMKSSREAERIAAEARADREAAEAKARQLFKVAELTAEAKAAGVDLSLLYAGKLDDAADYEIDAAFRTLDKIRPDKVVPLPASPKKPVFAGSARVAFGKAATAVIKAYKGDPTARNEVRAAWDEARAKVQAGADEPWIEEALDDGLVSAALNDVGTSDTLGLVPPQYLSRVIIPGMVATPLLDNCCIREPLPTVGMSLVKPHLSADVNGAYTTTELAQPATNDVTWTTDTISVEMYQHAIRASYALVERGDFGGYAANYYSRVLNNHQSAKEAKLAAAIVAGAHVTVTNGATITANMMQLWVQALSQQADTEGSFGGMMPDYIILSPDKVAEFANTALTAGGAYTTGASLGTSFVGGFWGMTVVTSPNMSTDTIIVGARGATRVHEGGSGRYSVNIVSVASVELGYQAYDAFDVELPLALACNWGTSL